MAKRSCLCWHSENGARRDERRRDQNGWHTDTKAGESNPYSPANHRVEGHRKEAWDVVVAAAMLIVRNDEQSLIPIRAISRNMHA